MIPPSALLNRTFRRIWLASLVSGTAVAAHETATTWTMNLMSPSGLFSSLMASPSLVHEKLASSGDDGSFKYRKIPIGVSPLPGPRQLVTPEAWAADNKARKVIATERGAVLDALNFKTLNSTI